MSKETLRQSNQPGALRFRWAGLLAVLVGLALSIFLLIEYHTVRADPSHSSACDLSASLSCSAVARSEISAFLGLPIAWYGVVAFFVTLYLLVSTVWVELRAVLLVIATGGVLASCVLGALSRFVVGVLCPLCLGVYVVWLILFILSLWWNREAGLVRSLRQGFLGICRFPRFLAQSFGPGVHAALTLIGVLATIIVGIAAASVPVIVDFSPRAEPVENFFRAVVADWRSSPQQVIPSNGPEESAKFVRGPTDAPIEIVEFADFECGACQTVYPRIEELLREFDGRVRYSLRHFPLDTSCNRRMSRAMHRHACQLAEISRCAGIQGQFWEAVPALYRIGARSSSIEVLSLDTLLSEELGELKLDQNDLKECMTAGSQRKAIERDIEVADLLGLSGTPSFWVNGRRLERSSVEGLRAIILSELSSR